MNLNKKPFIINIDTWATNYSRLFLRIQILQNKLNSNFRIFSYTPIDTFEKIIALNWNVLYLVTTFLHFNVNIRITPIFPSHNITSYGTRIKMTFCFPGLFPSP